MLIVLVNSLQRKWLPGEVQLSWKNLHLSQGFKPLLHVIYIFMKLLSLCNTFTWSSHLILTMSWAKQDRKRCCSCTELGDGSKSWESGPHSPDSVLFIHSACCHLTLDVAASQGEMRLARRPNTCCNIANWHVGMNVCQHYQPNSIQATESPILKISTMTFPAVVLTRFYRRWWFLRVCLISFPFTAPMPSSFSP